MSSEEKATLNHSRKTANKSFEIVATFKCLGMALRDKNCMHEEIKSRLN
jgi:hypothetical protein